MSGPSRLLAFVRPEGDNGPVLAADGDFHKEVFEGGWDIENYNMPMSLPLYGLLIFEGFIEVGTEPEPDVSLSGEWRQLSHWEICRVRHGWLPW